MQGRLIAKMMVHLGAHPTFNGNFLERQEYVLKLARVPANSAAGIRAMVHVPPLRGYGAFLGRHIHIYNSMVSLAHKNQERPAWLFLAILVNGPLSLSA